MKILVAIANHGTGNKRHLTRLIAEYRSMPWHIDIVVLSDIPKSLSPDVEVRVGMPDRTNPWSLPFAHRNLFSERRHQYDLFIYSEDDTLVRECNIQAFLDATVLLAPNEIAGFMRSETDEAGNIHVSSMHSFFRWIPSQIMARGSEHFAKFSNDHAACYMLTRDQLAAVIDSGGFLVPPHQDRYDMLCSAATDVYTQCNLNRLICISRFRDFLLPHLPNKYIGRIGVPLVEVEAQIAALRRIAADSMWCGPLLDIETRLPYGTWSKNLYERPDSSLLEMIPRSTRRLLSVACGWGATEAALASKGIEVLALPIDPVFGDALRRRGIRTLDGALPHALAQLDDRAFDCVLLADALHLLPDPVDWLTRLRPLIEPKTGSLVISVPHTRDTLTRWKTLGSARRALLQPVSAWGVTPTSARQISTWLDSAQFTRVKIVNVLSRKRAFAAAATLGALRSVLAQRFLVSASVCRAAGDLAAPGR